MQALIYKQFKNLVYAKERGKVSFYNTLTESKPVFVFPGQGTQSVGMGADLARDFSEAKLVFQEVDDALNQNLSALMFSGDIEELTQTQNAQPAIMAVSMAIFRVLQKEIGASFGKSISAVAGHSLGEYSALCAAGVLSLADTAKLLQARGMAMAKACEALQGGMLALLGTDMAQATSIASQTGVYVANDNAPGQVVLSGSSPNLDRAKALAEQLGVRKAVYLPVMGAFHSPLMQKAADTMAPLLQQIKFKKSTIPVYFNVTAQVEQNQSNYASLLTQQIVAPVRWRELIQNTGATHFVECGVGAVLSGLIRRVTPSATVVNIGTSVDINSCVLK